MGIFNHSNTCETCKHYTQHYIKTEYGYREIYCGHCVFPRIKNRDPYERKCSRYHEKKQNQKTACPSDPA